MQDPRHRNARLDSSSISACISDYAGKLSAALSAVDAMAVDAACTAIMRAAAGKSRIYVAGNGGSAAIADHLCCDWTKGTNVPGHAVIRTHSLSANVALYSAIANDYGFEQGFSTQVGFFGDQGDLLIAISSSGNSENIIEAVRTAKAAGMIVIGMSGFSGGKLAAMADISIHVAASNYGIVEDAHQAIMHVIAQFIAAQRDAVARP